MSNLNWIETKKECEVEENGELKTKKVTLELAKQKYLGLEKKEAIDIFLRVLSLATIFIPVLLFFQQRNAELNKQKSLYQLGVYSTTITELHSFINKVIGTKEFDESASKVLYEIYPKLVLLNDKNVNNSFNPIKTTTEFSQVMSQVYKTSDAFFTITDSIMLLMMDKTLRNYPNNPEFFKRNYQIKSQVDSYLKQLDRLVIDEDKFNDMTFKKLKSKAFEIVNNLKTAVINFNDNIYYEQAINQSNELTNIRDAILLYKEDHKLYNNNFLSKNIPYLDSIMIETNSLIH